MSASYRLRIVYTGDMFQVKIGLKANDSVEVHPPLLKPRDMKPLEFDLPATAHPRRDIDADLDSRAESWRQWPRLPGVGGVVDQEIGRGLSGNSAWGARGSCTARQNDEQGSRSG